MVKRKISNYTIISGLILILAAFLRLYRIADYMTFLGDEGRDVLVVYNILHGHFTLLGPTASVGGFYFGPIYYYMMAPFLWLFNYNPVGPAVLVALIGTATVYVVLKTGSEFFGKSAGLLSAFLYALSPLVIMYSRSSWNPNPVPFFSLLTIYFLYLAYTKKKNKWFLFSGISIGIGVELHFIVLFLAVVVGLVVLVKNLYLEKILQKSLTIKEILIQWGLLACGFIIGWIPYLGFEIRHNFANTKSIIAFIFHSKNTGGNSHFFQIIGNVFFNLFGHLITEFPTPDHFPSFNSYAVIAWGIGTLLIALSCLGLALWQFFRSKQYSVKKLQYLLITVWLVVGVTLFGFYKKQIYDYYFTFLFPVPFLLTGDVLHMLWQTKKSIARICSIGAFIGIVVLDLLGVPFRYEPNRQLAQTEEIAKFVLDKTEGKAYNFALITGGNSDHAYRYFLTLWGYPPQTIENPAVDPSRATVTGQLLVICESIPCFPLGNPLFEVAGFGRADIKGHWKVSVVEVYRLVHYKGT